MRKEICILTKSYKNNGYCVAGIDLESHQWVRLVTSEDPKDDEVKKYQLDGRYKNINCYDIIDINLLKNIPCNCQTENWLITKGGLIVKKSSLSELEAIDLISIDNDENFILNRNRVLNQYEITKINKSLFAYEVKYFSVDINYYEGKNRYKCSFLYNNYRYEDISLTDPDFRDIDMNNTKLEKAIIIASLPSIPYENGYYYKFVAKVIPIG